MTEEERKKIKESYQEKIPNPLTSQFTSRTPKNEAKKCFKERKARTAELFPSGK